MEAAPDTGSTPLKGGQNLAPHADARVGGVRVGGIFKRVDPTTLQEVHDLVPPNRQERANESASAGGHATQAGQAAASNEVQNRALDEVVGRVTERDDVRSALVARALEEVVPEFARGRLERATGDRGAAALRHQPHAQAAAQVCNVVGGRSRSGLKSVVVMGGDHVLAVLEDGD
jgi:hypothetical protein